MYNFRKPIKMCLRKSVSRQRNNNAIQSLCKQGKLKEQTMAGKLRVLIWRELNSTESKSPATNCCFVYSKLCVFFCPSCLSLFTLLLPIKMCFYWFFGLFLYPPPHHHHPKKNFLETHNYCTPYLLYTLPKHLPFVKCPWFQMKSY